ncbi:MAG: nucleoside kinase [Euryarchaeota archaeon]|nr:nucleoside kinase [Euryarchaeota archaeon]
MDRIISVVGHTALDYIVNVENIAGKNESSPVIDYEEYPGGGAANIAVAIAKLGGKSQLISPVGTDFSSSGYEKLLLEAGVDLSRLYSIEDRKISKAFILRTGKITRRLIFIGGLPQNSKIWNLRLQILSILQQQIASTMQRYHRSQVLYLLIPGRTWSLTQKKISRQFLPTLTSSLQTGMKSGGSQR